MSEEIRKAVEELDALIVEQKKLMHQAWEEGDWQRYNELSSYQNGLKKARKILCPGSSDFIPPIE